MTALEGAAGGWGIRADGGLKGGLGKGANATCTTPGASEAQALERAGTASGQARAAPPLRL
jgi:hypothetical protein